MKTENRNIEEKLLHPMNGGVMLIVDLILLVACGFLFAFGIRQSMYGHIAAAAADLSIFLRILKTAFSAVHLPPAV